MTTLRLPTLEDLSPEDRELAGRIAKMMGRNPWQEATGPFRAMGHWPQLLEANHRQALYSFNFKGALPELTKHAMHVAVSVTHRCEF
ncbi:MAG: hypothetical protein KGJ86_18150 [Chloroflexota bacterium]|nr:hypothetical protein [Chloroflexota bacterium]